MNANARRMIVTLVLLGSGCTDEQRTVDALRKAGFTDINPGGYAWFACGDDYTFETEFTAKNPQGAVVSGAVCCGFLKGCSVKF